MPCWEGLRERLERKPDDAQGWVLLAKSYQHLQRWDEAEAAFAKAEVLGYSSAVAGQGQQVSSAPVFQAIDQMVAEEGKPKVGPAIHLQLSVSSDIATQLAPEQRVFVFARPLTGGPPLAVVRKTVAELPAEIILNEQVAMVPEHGLSTGAYIVVGARISATGQPEKSPGDIEVLSEAIVVSKDTRLGLMLGASVAGE